MRPQLVRFSLVLCALAVASCSSKSGPTYPSSSTGGGPLSGSLAGSGAQYAHAFATAGTFHYACTIHPACASLQGTIVVVAPGTPITNRVLAISIDGGSAGGPYGGATCSSLSTQLDTVQVGDQVTWTNNSTLPHNVTSQ
ncbi:MAG TPA: hypothetical protein VFK69_06770 [Candidatus Eisenbacteria bacterium]|nr:hypothetical protein [Candidatus Eisenbacteria bacterium]